MLNGYSLSYIMTAISVLSFWIKLKAEEKVLIGQFGDQYRIYQTTSKHLIPFVI